MPQRALSKTRPWTFVSADDMSEYDQLAELQLLGHLAMEDPNKLINDMAFEGAPKFAPVVASPTKRKRNDFAAVVVSPNKRVKSSKPQSTPEVIATPYPKVGSKKLVRPNKVQKRHMIATYPVVKKPKGDIWDPTSISPETVPSRMTREEQTRKPKKVMSQTQQRPTDPSDVDDSTPAVGRVRKMTRARGKGSTEHNQGNTAPNGNVHVTGKIERKRGRPRKTKALDKKEKPSAQKNTTAEATQSSQTTQNDCEKTPPSGQGALDKEIDSAGKDDQRAEESAGNDETNKERKVDNHEQGEVDDIREAPPDQDAESSKQSDEEESEGKYSDSDSDNTSEDQPMDLLGQETKWDKVLESARAVPKLRYCTKAIRDLVRFIKEAQSLYNQFLHSKETNAQALNETKTQLEGDLGDVEGKIHRIMDAQDQEKGESNKTANTVQDIYSRAIPAMVFLIESALRVRTGQSRGLHRYAALKEIIRLQSILHSLCGKVLDSGIKPKTGEPIIKPTRSVIFPYVRDMRKAFMKELPELERQRRIQKNAKETTRKEKNRQQPRIIKQSYIQYFQEEYQKHADEELALIGAPIPRKEKSSTGRDKSISSLHNKQAPFAKTHEWTEEEVVELCEELRKMEYGELSYDDCCVKALDNPVLQNMLPEHISQKALDLKPLLLEIAKSEPSIRPWVDCISFCLEASAAEDRQNGKGEFVTYDATEEWPVVSMWSHTIQSSKPKAPVASNERATKANAPAIASKRSSLDVAQEQDMTQEFDADGFSKTSRIRASRKPLTVAKAPTLGRTTSSKADQPPTTPKESVRPTPEKRTSRPTPQQPAKGVAPVRTPRTGTPSQPASGAARTRAPVLSSRAKTPTQGAPKSRAETPTNGRPALSSPRAARQPKVNVSTPRSKINAKSPTAEAKDSHESNIEKDFELEDTVENDLPVDQEVKPADTLGLDGDQDFVRSPDEEASNSIGEPIVDTGQKEGPPSRDIVAHMNHEISLKNETIDSLRHELQVSQSDHERKSRELEATSAAQLQSLQSELDGVRRTLADLDDTHQSTLEKHDSLLRSRDKIIQNLSQESEGFRTKLEKNDPDQDPAVEDRGEKRQAVEQENRMPNQEDLLKSKDREITSLSETVQDLRKQLEAADTARAKEIYDELLRSKDKEIASVSGVVKDLKGELQATDGRAVQKNHDKMIKSKDEKIKSLSDTVKALHEKLDATNKSKEQEVNHSMSLRDEFQDLQNKHKRKIEDLEASATARAEALQSEYDELLRSRDQEIKDVSGMAQELQKEIETAREDQRRQLEDTNFKHQQQLHHAKAASGEELRSAISRHEDEAKAIRDAQSEVESKHAAEIQVLVRKHKHELDSARSDQQNVETNHQQELREVKRKHEQALESIRTEAENGFRDDISRLERELEDITVKHDRDIEQIKTEHREEIDRSVKDHEQASKELAAQHEQELEEANTKYQKELADVERLRGEGSDEILQKHEKQLETITEKFQQELDEANQKLHERASSNEQQLEESKAQSQEIRIQADKYLNELKEARARQEALEREKSTQGGKLVELTTVHEKEMGNAAAKHQEDIDEASAKNVKLTEALDQEREQHREKVHLLDQELEHARDESSTIAAETTTLKAVVEELRLSRSKLEADTRLTHETELKDLSSKHQHDLSQLRTEHEASVAEIDSLKKATEQSDTLRTQIENEASMKHKQLSQDLNTEHDQAVARLRSEHESSLAEMAATQAEFQSLNQKLVEELASLKDISKHAESSQNEARGEANVLKDKVELVSREKEQHLSELSSLRVDIEGLERRLNDSAKDLRQREEEASVEIALQKDKLELASRANASHEETITRLQSDVEELRAQLLESSEALNRERNEAGVEIALLKDKLELAELQKQSASEDMSLSQNEANVEIALLKDKLELADLQSQDDKKTTAALEERLRELQAKPVDTAPFLHHQLREELAMLARHHAANLEDLGALKASVLAERELREEEWRRRAEDRQRITKEMQGIGAELNGITGVH
ncbi:hypothetical protein ACLMJK_007845 [Lecanora helva]